jgi:Raf kinase inhibitor-like YbhB/YbcL family protein
MPKKFLTALLCCALLACVFMLAACRRADSDGMSANVAPSPAPSVKGEEKMTLKLTSTAFEEGGLIPPRHTCDGEDISPPLAWSGVPEGAKSLALVADDPDAPRGTWVHWVIYNIPASEKGLAENVPERETLDGGARHGTNDFKKAGYGGPCPPSGTHRYFFKLYALDAEPDLPSGVSKDQLLKAIEGHVVAEGQLMGRYRRGKP